MTRRAILLALLPLVLTALVAVAFIAGDPLRRFAGAAPPVEELTVERTVLERGGIALRVRAGGSEALSIVQVQVDDAYWSFRQDPPGPLDRLRAAWIRIPYPWVLGEAHAVRLVSSTGATFEHEIPVAVPTPAPTAGTLRAYGLIGLFVGVVPVALGMLFYPALRAGGGRLTGFALALTAGLLAFLLVDTLAEALELSRVAAPSFQGPTVVWLAAASTFALLMAIGRRRGRALSGLPLATSIALGIGLHNLGEGLAIGSAFATGAAALGSFLVLGFTLHNVTEGIGIVAPLTERRPRPAAFAGLAALAGLPAVAGLWLGGLAFASHWAALALAVGAGAILQVLVEVGWLMLRRVPADGRRWLPAPALSGLLLGVAVMYATALLVQV